MADFPVFCSFAFLTLASFTEHKSPKQELAKWGNQLEVKWQEKEAGRKWSWGVGDWMGVEKDFILFLHLVLSFSQSKLLFTLITITKIASEK